MNRYEQIADRLRGIAEELDEASFDLLQDAIAEGATRRPDEDRTVTQARRAVEKAVTLLDRLASGEHRGP